MKSPSLFPSENPAQLRAALSLSGNGIMLFECLRTATGAIQDFRLVLANRKAEEMTGLSEQAMLNRTGTDLFPDSLSTDIWDHARHVVETDEPYETEFCYRTANRTDDGWYALVLQRYGDGLAASFTDITAGKRHEQELTALIENLQRSNQNLKRFAYVASHDLQEPLRKILSFGDILRSQSGGEMNDRNAELIGRMQSAAGRMNTLIQDLLAFSRLSSQPSFERVNLQEIVDDMLTDLETAIQQKRAQVELTSLPIVFGDALQLRQVFQNLLSNALKFVKPAGSRTPLVRIDCERMDGNRIVALPGQSVAAADGDRAFYAISVTDNGIGFDEKYLDRMFTIFQRLHTRTEYEGTGIGLTIVQKVLDNHKGYIGAHSRPGQGATFTVYLPA